MARILRHWISPTQEDGPGTAMEAIERVRAHTPAGWEGRVLVPALYGEIWQADETLYNTCGMEIRPKDGPDLQWVRNLFEREGVKCGAWGVPRRLTYMEGRAHGEAAAYVEDYVLDLEPYDKFLVPPFDRGPEEFIKGYSEVCQRRPHVSVDPRVWGTEPIGAALPHWFAWARSLRLQCYWTDDPVGLDPTAGVARVKGLLKGMGLSRPVVAMYPATGGARLRTLLGRARSERDIWRLG